jgi:hypothetical protein
VIAKSRNSKIKHSYADITRFKEDFGFVLKSNLDASINGMLASLKICVCIRWLENSLLIAARKNPNCSSILFRSED